MDHPLRPADGVPYWDYADPAVPDAPRDASAGAVFASALYELYAHTGEDAYLREADAIVAALGSTYRARGPMPHPFILDQSVGNRPRSDEVSVPIIYADYYYVEALLRRIALDEGATVAPQVAAR